MDLTRAGRARRPRPSYPLAYRLAAPLALLTALTTLTTVLAASSAQASSNVDAFSSYQPQTTCRSTPLPGTVFLLHWLQRHYPHPGFSSMMRSCDTPGTSEHKDGRALDWGTDATDPAQKADAQAFLQRIFATDRHGNPDALARRMGIMYVIWNDHIYGAYTDPAFLERDYLDPSCKTRRRCSTTLRHRDHVHISLSYAGASAQTSFYRARGVPSVPVYYPGTHQLDTAQTAVVQVSVPSTGASVTTPFRVTKGTTYRIVADGLYRFGAGSQIGDAACAWDGSGWAPTDTGLLVDGRDPWGDSCADGHTHEVSYTAHRTGVLHLKIADPTPEDNTGSLTFAVVRPDLGAGTVATHPPVAGPAPTPAHRAGPPARRLLDETVTVPAARRRGALTRHSLRPGHEYRLVVTGVAQSGETSFDGKCVQYAGHYRPQYTMDLSQPDADHLSLYVAGVKVPLRATGPHHRWCSPTHRYVGRLTAPVAGRAHLRVWDPLDYGDNTGSLQVRIRRLS